MIGEIGHYALVLALGLALIQGTLPLLGAARGDAGLMALARSSALGQLLFLTIAFAALIQGFVVSDFSLANVAANSHSSKPLIYKVAAAWGNHEGSLVLWVWILALYGAGVALLGNNLPPPFQILARRRSLVERSQEHDEVGAVRLAEPVQRAVADHRADVGDPGNPLQDLFDPLGDAGGAIDRCAFGQLRLDEEGALVLRRQAVGTVRNSQALRAMNPPTTTRLITATRTSRLTIEA